MAKRLDRATRVRARPGRGSDPIHVLVIRLEHGVGGDRTSRVELRDDVVVHPDPLHARGDRVSREDGRDRRDWRVTDRETRPNAGGVVRTRLFDRSDRVDRRRRGTA